MTSRLHEQMTYSKRYDGSLSAFTVTPEGRNFPYQVTVSGSAVTYVEPTSDGTCAMIHFVGGGALLVQESYETLRSLLSGGVF
jgi:hypothetical protein